jgi:seryl-tRNA synthetase
MAEFRPATSDQRELLSELLAAGLLIETRVVGVYGRGRDFEGVCAGFAELITRAGAGDEPERMSFPPVMPRHDLEAVEYLKSFPHLSGSIFGFEGGESEANELHQRANRHEDWSEFQSMTDLVLTPAACYPVYPAVAARGPLPAGGVTVDAGGAYVFRHEPSGDPARLQMFRQREIVRIGEPETVEAWWCRWRERAVELLTGMGLAVHLDVASDPFFGRGGRMLAASQRQQALKFEVTCQIAGPEPTALASFNYHRDHFASVFGIELAGGGVAHTACLGFGLERTALALFRTHGLELGRWPAAVREELLRG